MVVTEIILQLFVIFVAAKLAGEVFSRLDQPPVIGELLVGILIGPHVLGLVGTPGPALVGSVGEEKAAAGIVHAVLDVAAELGVIILLFVVGLETRVSDILRVGRRAGLVAVGGVALPFALGFGFGLVVGLHQLAALFLGAALVATSIGITARVLGDLGQLRTTPARVIIGAAVIDDILGMIVLAIAIGIASGGALSWAGIVVLSLEAIGFTVFVVLVGTRVIQQYSTQLGALRIRNAPFVVALGVCLGLATLAGFIGLAAIIGAFLAGMVFAEARERDTLEHQVQPLYDFLVPFFFVMTGTRVDPALFLDSSLVAFAGAFTLLAIVGKLVGGGMGALGMGWRPLAIIGVGMVPRGEVGLVVAGIGQSTGALSGAVFSTIVIMSVLTTLIVPPVLKLLLARRDPEPAVLSEHSPALRRREAEVGRRSA